MRAVEESGEHVEVDQLYVNGCKLCLYCIAKKAYNKDTSTHVCPIESCDMSCCMEEQPTRDCNMCAQPRVKTRRVCETAVLIWKLVSCMITIYSVKVFY